MKLRPVEWVPAVVAVALFAGASVITAVYYGDTWAISYPTPLSAQLLWQHRTGVSVATLREAWSTGLYDLAFVVTVVAWPFLLRRGSDRARWVAAALPLLLLFPINILGAYVALFDALLRPGWDGETLAEGWPLIELYGLWSVWAAGFLVHLWLTRHRIRTAHASVASQHAP